MNERSRRRVRVRVRTRTTLAMAVVTLMATFHTGPAQAAGGAIQALKVAQSRDSVLDYWTDARMEDAQPADAGDAESAGQPPVPLSTGEPQAFEGTDAPLNLARSGRHAEEQNSVPTEGKIFFTGSDGFDYMCSGTAVISDNESTVWTAGHCVHGGFGQTYHHNWIFIPGYDDGDAPYGVWTAESLQTPTGWARFSSFKYDVGAATVATNNGTTLGDTVGMEGIAFNQPAHQVWTSLGYPAGRPFDGSDLYSCKSRTLGRHNPDFINGQRTLFIRCDMNGGSSGGGWFFTQDGNRYVGSLNSYGVMGHRDRMYGPYQGPAAYALWSSAQSA